MRLTKIYLLLALSLIALTSGCKTSSTTAVSGTQVYRVENYGILPEDGFDNTSGLKKLLEEIDNGSTILFGTGEYYFAGTVITPKAVNIVGDKSGTTIRTERTWIKFIGTEIGQAVRLKSLSTAQQDILEPMNGVPVGAIVCFSSEEIFAEKDVPYTKTHCNLVAASTTQGQLLRDAVPYAFNKQLKASYYAPKPITIERITIQGGNDLYQIEVHHRHRPVFKSVTFKTDQKRLFGKSAIHEKRIAGTSGLALYGCIDGVVESCDFENIWYGVLAHKGCFNTTIRRSTATNCHHLNNFALGSANNLVEHCSATGCEGGFDSHPTAINSRFRYCRDINPVLASKFRGRIDIIENCDFSGGIEFFYDTNIRQLFGEVELKKHIVNSTVSGRDIPISGPNVRLENTVFSQGVRFSKSAGYVQVIGCKFESTSVHENNFQEMLTVGNLPLEECTYSLEITDCEFIEETGRYTMGIYFPGHYARTGSVKNVTISGFQKGLVLYGGAAAALGYQRLSFENITFRDCQYGVFSDHSIKKIAGKNINMVGCKVQTNRRESLPGFF